MWPGSKVAQQINGRRRPNLTPSWVKKTLGSNVTLVPYTRAVSAPPSATM
jgi:hypothetical protein